MAGSGLGICSRCGRIAVIYDRRGDICFACYGRMSMTKIVDKERRRQSEIVMGDVKSTGLDIKV